MSVKRTDRIQALFARALELAPDERAAFVEAQAGGEPELRGELSSLLAHAQDEAFLATPAVLEELDAGERSERAALGPGRLGPFELLRVLGEGGMGVVHLAREVELDRLVALKVLRPGLTSPSSLARFEREARALAKLHHPGVAQVHAAGTLDAGAGPQPYFAMERVEGLPITEHAEREGLEFAARLELLAQVADAIDHAHARGVVHRDLKPSNVLVDLSTSRAQPKVLDFGVARLLDEQAPGSRTLAGQIIGTLAYMSPEQAAGDSSAIGPAADVYGLGALGYELVTGRTPLDLSGMTLTEAARRVRETDPPPAGSFRPEARGEVETILARALAKEPQRRYPSAAELARDLRRYLADEPILARPPSGIYVARKFVRRHRVLVLSALAVVLALIAGTLASWLKAVEAASERDGARRERSLALESKRMAEAALAREAQQRREAQLSAERAQAVVSLMRRMLEDVHPDREGREVRVHDVLDRTAATLADELADHPHVELEMRTALGSIYHALGLYADAGRELVSAEALAVRLHGELGVATQHVRVLLGILRHAEGATREAQVLLENALSRSLLLLGEEDRQSLFAMRSFAHRVAPRGDPAWAEELLRRVLGHTERILGSHADDTLSVLHRLGSLLEQQGRLEEARSVLEQAHARSLEIYGPLHPKSVPILEALGTVLRHQGSVDEAASALRRTLDTHRATLGAEHPRTWTAMNNLAALLQAEGRHGEAEELLREVIERRGVFLGGEHPDTLIALNNLALLLAETDRLPEARELHERVLEIKRRTLGADDRSTLTSHFNLGLIHLRLGEFEPAESIFADVSSRARRAYPAGHWQIPAYAEGHGAILLALGRLREAEEVLLGAHAEMSSALGIEHARARSLARRIAVLLDTDGRTEEARAWRERGGS